MKPRIIQLGNNTQIGRVIAFDDAFDDYSEAGGSQRRANRLQRVRDKDEIKTERSTRRIGRKASRKVARVEKRGAKQEAKINKRATAQEMRQGKRTNKVIAKTERKGIRRDGLYGGDVPMPIDDTAIDQGEVLNNEQQYDQPYDENTNNQPNEDNQGEGETIDYGTSSGEDWEGDAPNMYEDEQGSGGDDSTESSNEVAEDDSLDYSFAGVMGAEDFYSRLTADNKKVVEVTPEIEGVATKIEWHKENLSRLRVQRAKNLGEGRYTGDLEEKMRESIQRIHDLENILHKYTNFQGEFMENNDTNFVDFLNMDGKTKPTRAQKRKRYCEVGKAQGIARKKRDNYLMKQQAKQQKVYGGDATQVDADLNPIFQPQRIIVNPGMSNASGTGLVGLDDVNDFDAPPIRKVEITSNASGEMGKGINWTAVTLGVAIGVFAIAFWGVEGKYKMIK